MFNIKYYSCTFITLMFLVSARAAEKRIYFGAASDTGRDKRGTNAWQPNASSLNGMNAYYGQTQNPRFNITIKHVAVAPVSPAQIRAYDFASAKRLYLNSPHLILHINAVASEFRAMPVAILAMQKNHLEHGSNLQVTETYDYFQVDLDVLREAWSKSSVVRCCLLDMMKLPRSTESLTAAQEAGVHPALLKKFYDHEYFMQVAPEVIQAREQGLRMFYRKSEPLHAQIKEASENYSKGIFDIKQYPLIEQEVHNLSDYDKQKRAILFQQGNEHLNANSDLYHHWSAELETFVKNLETSMDEKNNIITVCSEQIATLNTILSYGQKCRMQKTAEETAFVHDIYKKIDESECFAHGALSRKNIHLSLVSEITPEAKLFFEHCKIDVSTCKDFANNAIQKNLVTELFSFAHSAGTELIAINKASQSDLALNQSEKYVETIAIEPVSLDIIPDRIGNPVQKPFTSLSIESLQKYQDQGLVQAFQTTRQNAGTVHTIIYSVNPETTVALGKLGVTIKDGSNLELTGNHVQHYIQEKLIESLHKIVSIPQTNTQVNEVLKVAVNCNMAGQQLVRQNKIEHAMEALTAYDKMLDLGSAIVEGAKEAFISTAQTTIDIGQAATNIGGLVGKALGGNEVAQCKIEFAFKRAAFAMAQFAQRHAGHMALDTVILGSVPLAIGQSVTRDLEQPVKLMYTEFLAMPTRDKAKAISKFIVEGECFGILGNIIGRTVKTGHAALAGTIRSLTVSEALIEEAVSLTSQALATESHVLHAVTDAVQKEVTFLTNVEEITSFVSKECSSFAAGQEFVDKIIAEMSSLKIPSKMAAVELLANVHPEVISIDKLVAAIERYHNIPGFTGYSDAMLERILRQGDARVIAHASNVEEAIKRIRGTVFEIETAMKLEAAGEKITEFGAKYHRVGEIIRKGANPLDFDLATADLLAECKSGNLFHIANDPNELNKFVKSILTHKEAAEKVAGKKYLLITAKPVPEQLKTILKASGVNFLEP